MASIDISPQCQSEGSLCQESWVLGCLLTLFHNVNRRESLCQESWVLWCLLTLFHNVNGREDSRRKPRNFMGARVGVMWLLTLFHNVNEKKLEQGLAETTYKPKK